MGMMPMVIHTTLMELTAAILIMDEVEDIVLITQGELNLLAQHNNNNRAADHKQLKRRRI